MHLSPPKAARSDSKINDFDVLKLIVYYHDICWLDVSVHDLLVVTEHEGFDQLLQNYSHLVLVQNAVFLEVSVQVAAGKVLHDDGYGLAVDEHRVEFDDPFVGQEAEAFGFSG